MPALSTHPPPQASHYETLGISSTATAEEIKRAYRRLVLQHHPDKLKDGDTSSLFADGAQTVLETTEASIIGYDTANNDPRLDNNDTRRASQSNNNISKDNNSNNGVTTSFHQIQTAYTTLRNPTTRHQYDTALERISHTSNLQYTAASLVYTSEMDMEKCIITVSDEEECEVETTMYCYECRCGYVFEILHEELLPTLDDTSDDDDNHEEKEGKVWNCGGCSLMIRVVVDT
eukprot:scaffold15934_cov52-Cyclotella_meneghiniana.AAC.15